MTLFNLCHIYGFSKEVDGDVQSLESVSSAVHTDSLQHQGTNMSGKLLPPRHTDSNKTFITHEEVIQSNKTKHCRSSLKYLLIILLDRRRKEDEKQSKDREKERYSEIF